MNEFITPDLERTYGNAEQRIYRFANGYGAGVVRSRFGLTSRGADQGLWELAVFHFRGPMTDVDYELIDDTPVTDDTIGWLDENGIQETLRQIRDLPAREAVAK